MCVVLWTPSTRPVPSTESPVSTEGTGQTWDMVVTYLPLVGAGAQLGLGNRVFHVLLLLLFLVSGQSAEQGEENCSTAKGQQSTVGEGIRRDVRRPHLHAPLRLHGKGGVERLVIEKKREQTRSIDKLSLTSHWPMSMPLSGRD